MTQHRVALTHVGGIASEAILEKLPESGLTPDSVVLLGEEVNVASKLAYAGTYLTVEDQHSYSFDDCSLVLMPEYDASVEQRLSTLDALLLSHVIENQAPAVFAGSRDAEIKVSYTQSSLRATEPLLSCLLGVLPALHQSFEITGVNLVFLQSAESNGKPAIDELASQTIALLSAREAIAEVYPLQMAFNMLPTGLIPNLNSDLLQILGNCDINCVHQVVNVPVFHGMLASVQLEFAEEVGLACFQARLNEIAGVYLSEADASPISDCNQSFSCVINRLEQVQNQAKFIQFWMIADPMRYGLANNYVNITDILLKSFL
ncbi:MAG: hypothetical protein GY820_36805 [Gammaproteobacteria bacterium]|nr:hypothetical protein [Gammaproteobacteria bacterium]